MDDGFVIFEDVDDLLAVITDRCPVEQVMGHAIDVCERRHPHAVWDELRGLPFAADVERSLAWWQALLRDERPDDEVNGFWFGIFNPLLDPDGHMVTDANGPTEAASAFYVDGGTAWPAEDWFERCDMWGPKGRYAESPVMIDLYRRTEATEDEVATYFGDFFLTLAFTGATVVSIVEATSSELLLGGAAARGVAFGHDSGSGNVIGVITPDSTRWSHAPDS